MAARTVAGDMVVFLVRQAIARIATRSAVDSDEIAGFHSAGNRDDTADCASARIPEIGSLCD